MTPVNCTLPVLAIGPRLNSSKELTRFVRRHEHVLVGISAASCANCCLWEPMYNETLRLLPTGVRWARIDLDRLEAKALAATYDIDNLPTVVFFRNRRSSRLIEVQRSRSIIALVERSLSPLPVVLGGSVEWNAWFEFGSAFDPVGSSYAQELPVRTLQVARVAALVDEHVEEEDLDEVIEAARSFAGRPLSFQFIRSADPLARQLLANHPLVSSVCGGITKQRRALVVVSLFDGEFVEMARIQHGTAGPVGAAAVRVALPKGPVGGITFNSSVAGPSAADTGGMSTQVGVLPRVACRPLDAYDGLSVEQWVLRASLPPVGRFDPMTFSLYEKTQKPFLMLFADTKRPELTDWLKLLHAAQTHYNRGEGDSLRLMFVYIDGLHFSHRMPSLGLTADPERLPALSFNFVTEHFVTWQPPAAAYKNGSAALTGEVVDSLVQRYLRGDGQQLVEKKAPKPLPVPKRTAALGERREVPDLASLSLEERLRYVFAVSHDSFTETVMDTSRDVAIYFYASKGERMEASKAGAIHVNRCVERFEELGITTVRVVRLDMARFTAPANVQVSEVPSFVLFPAFSKEPPHQFFRGKWKVQHIMWWIQDHASRKFRLPELPHLDELETKAYWEQKRELDQERQQRVAAESEGSVRRRGSSARAEL